MFMFSPCTIQYDDSIGWMKRSYSYGTIIGWNNYPMKLHLLNCWSLTFVKFNTRRNGIWFRNIVEMLNQALDIANFVHSHNYFPKQI